MHMCMFMCMNPMPIIRKHILEVSQAELASIAGTSQATVSRWEKGDQHPDRDQMDRIRAEVRRRRKKWNDVWFFDASAIPLKETARVA